MDAIMMAGTRREGRECALQILYQLESSQNGFEISSDLSLVEAQVDSFFDNFEAPQSVYQHALELVKGTVKYIQEINELINLHSTKWKLSRMARVDRNILRLSGYELLYCDDLPMRVVIDEAIEIARKFGSEQSAAFVNGVLDKMATVRNKKGSDCL